MKKILLGLVGLMLFGCTLEEPTEFSEKALKDTFLTITGESIDFQEIVNKYKGKKILVNVWASWCRDCIEALPEEKKLQEENQDIVFLHLSLDRDLESWKEGIKRLGIKGEHYFIKSGWKGDFGEFLNLNWIPRYLIIDEESKIKLFKATKLIDKLIKENLKK